MRLLLAGAVLASACDPAAPPLADCGGDLRGVWRAPGATASGEPRRFQIISAPWAWEIFPMYDDGVIEGGVPDGVIAAPSAMDLVRFGGPAPLLFGTWSRRFERGADTCWVRHVVLIEQCRGDAITLTSKAPIAPPDVTRCTDTAEGPPIEWRLTRD